MMMQMYFYASAKATILFEAWDTASWAALFGSCIAVLLMAVIYEGIKSLRVHLLSTARMRAHRKGMDPTEYSTLGGNNGDQVSTGEHRSISEVILGKDHMIQTALHFVQATLGYSLMLIAMTFNIWLFMAVILGMTLGYFICGWKQQKSFTQDCCS